MTPSSKSDIYATIYGSSHFFLFNRDHDVTLTMSRSLALTLPQELVDIIVDNLKSSKKGLRKCSFISHRYLHRVRKYSFSTLTFNTWVEQGDTKDPFHVDGLSELLSSSQNVFGDEFKLGNYIHDLAIFCEPGEAHEAIVDLQRLVTLLKCLPSLQSLRLTRVTLSCSVDSDIPTNAFNLTKMDLSVIRPRNKTILPSFFSLFAKITTLNMHSYTYIHPAKSEYWPGIPYPTSKPQVEHLLVSTLFHPEYLDILAECIDYTLIKSVSLRCALTFNQVETLLLSIARTVENLWIRPSFSPSEFLCAITPQD